MTSGLHIGRHYSPGGKNLTESARAALSEPASAIQIFAGNPQRYWGAKTTDEARELWLQATEGIHKVVHSVYITNLGEDPTMRGYKMTCHSLVNQLEWCDRHGIDQFVFHPGSPKQRDRATALQDALDGMRDVCARYEGSCTILLENAAHPQKIGGDYTELLELVHDINDPRVGICIDTTHAFASGYNVTQIVPQIEHHATRLVHFNTPDQPVECGNKRDLHSSTFEDGKFTKQELLSLFLASRELPMILEGTPNLAEDLVWLLGWEMELRETGGVQTPVSPASELGPLFADA